jgi:hypothetical protein
LLCNNIKNEKLVTRRIHCFTLTHAFNFLAPRHTCCYTVLFHLSRSATVGALLHHTTLAPHTQPNHRPPLPASHRRLAPHRQQHAIPATQSHASRVVSHTTHDPTTPRRKTQGRDAARIWFGAHRGCGCSCGTRTAPRASGSRQQPRRYRARQCLEPAKQNAKWVPKFARIAQAQPR